MTDSNVNAINAHIATLKLRFLQKGFCPVRAALQPEEIERWRELSEQVLNREAAKAKGHPYHSTIFAIHRLADKYPQYMQLVRSPSLGRIAEILLEDKPAVFLDQLICKPPNGKATIPHQDAPFLPLGGQPTVNCWIPLQDVDESNGALIYYDGFDRIPDFPLVHLDGAADQLDVAKLGLSGEPLTMAAGDCVFHDGKTVHGAAKNNSGDPRFAISIQYMVDGARAYEPLHPFMLKLGICVGDRLTGNLFVRPGQD